MKNRKEVSYNRITSTTELKTKLICKLGFFIIEFEIFNHVELMVQRLICAENVWKKLGRNARYRRDSNR